MFEASPGPCAVAISSGSALAAHGHNSKLSRTSKLSLVLALIFVSYAYHVEAQSFVRAEGTRFVYQGHAITFYGATFFPSPVGGSSAWHRSTFPAYIDHIIVRAQQAGQNILRPTDFWNKKDPNQNFQDPVIWANMDYLLSACKKHGMFVLLDISAFKWLLTAKGQNVTDPTNWNSFLDFVAARYANEPTVAFWSIMGEPAVPVTPGERDSLLVFYDSVTTRLHKNDRTHLICAGAFNHMKEHTELSWWQRIYSLPNNDIAGFKTYSQNDLDLIPKIASYARSINKPTIDEEFGMPQNVGDCDWSGSTFNHLDMSRTQFFKEVYKRGLAGGVAGFLFWNLGDQVAPTSYEVSPSSQCLWAVLQQYSPREGSRAR